MAKLDVLWDTAGMRTRYLLTWLCCLASLTGCLQKQLAGPVEDHKVLTGVVAEKHARGDYAGAEQQLQDDLEAIAEQAELLDNIVKGEMPDEETDR